jgi:alcohol dehydrogenase class IV
VLLPKLLRAYGDSVTRPLAELAYAVGLADSSLSRKDAAELIISHIEGMNRRMGIPESLGCVKPEDIPEMAKLADKEANPLYPVPTLWDAKELEKIYLLI